MHLSPTLSPLSRSTRDLQFKFAEFSKCKSEIVEIFHKKIESLYGDQAFNLEQFESGLSRRCEAMKKGKKILGIVAYMHKLQTISGDIHSSFEVRNLLLAKDKYYGKNYQTSLLQRIAKLAAEREAANVHFLVPPEDVKLVDLLKTKHFVQVGTKIISKDRKEALIFSCMIKQLKNQFDLDKPVEEEKKMKRKRNPDDDGSALRDNQPQKKTCFESNSNNELPLELKKSIVTQPYTHSLVNPSILPRIACERLLNRNNARHQELTLRKIYIHQIRDRRKDVEGRIWNNVQNYTAGDTIRFFYKANPSDDVRCRILKIDKYRSFAEMLETCGFARCIAEAQSLEEAKRIYDNIPGYQRRAAQHGVAAIHLEVIQ